MLVFRAQHHMPQSTFSLLPTLAMLHSFLCVPAHIYIFMYYNSAIYTHIIERRKGHKERTCRKDKFHCSETHSTHSTCTCTCCFHSGVCIEYTYHQYHSISILVRSLRICINFVLNFSTAAIHAQMLSIL